MRHEPVERVGATEQERLDFWFDTAMKDETVRPYLTTGVHTPRLTIPEDDYDGVVFMNRSDTGVLKLYNEEESGTMKIGIWVLTPKLDAPSRGETAFDLMKAAMVVARANPLVNYLGTRVMFTNRHGLNFSQRLFDHWGSEKNAVVDTSRFPHSHTGGWVSWEHFRSNISLVQNRMDDWEQLLSGSV